MIKLTNDPSNAKESYGESDVLDAVDTVSNTSKTIININFLPNVKRTQTKVYNWLKSHAKPSPFSTFGVSNVWEEIKLFQNHYPFFSLDLTSTYEIVTYTRVVGLFRSLKMPMPLAHAAECCYRGSLMRGGIPSNYILELILRRMDMRLGGIAKEYNLVYLRYVDDLFFFAKKIPKKTRKVVTQWLIVAPIISSIESIIKNEGFALNHSKTHISF